MDNIEIDEPSIYSVNESENIDGSPIYLSSNHPDYTEKTFVKSLNITYSTSNNIKNYELYPKTLDNNISNLSI
jgi:predicted small secreted protein